MLSQYHMGNRDKISHARKRITHDQLESTVENYMTDTIFIYGITDFVELKALTTYFKKHMLFHMDSKASNSFNLLSACHL